jgi:hypothetical protein
MKKAARNVAHLIDCSQERRLVCVRRLVKSANLSHELKRCGVYFFGSDGRIEVEKGFDVPAHSPLPQILSIATKLKKACVASDFYLKPGDFTCDAGAIGPESQVRSGG